MSLMCRVPISSPRLGTHQLQPAPVLRSSPAPLRGRSRLAAAAAAAGRSDGEWWQQDQKNWTMVSSSDQLQQVVDAAPNLVFVGESSSVFQVTIPLPKTFGTSQSDVGNIAQSTIAPMKLRSLRVNHGISQRMRGGAQIASRPGAGPAS